MPESMWARPDSPGADGRLRDAELIERIRDRFLETYLRDTPQDWLTSDAGVAEVTREIAGKYNDTLEWVVPWVARRLDLEGRTLVEVGCGTGAKSAAFAQHVSRVLACDISEPHLEAARARIEVMGLGNVSLALAPADDFLAQVGSEHPEGVDVCLLYALLEHLTLDERLDTLERCWELLKDGGLLVVLETPNRLLPMDYHTSNLPFFGMLPDELALRYWDRSPREDLREAMQAAGSRDDALMTLTRRGRAVSYHEFEVALGELNDKVVGDGYDVETLNLTPHQKDELDLKELFASRGVGRPAAFTRYWLDVILRKPAAGRAHDATRLPTAPATRRAVEIIDRPDARVLVDKRSTLEYEIPEGTGELVLGFLRHPEGGVLLVTERGGTRLAEIPLQRDEARVGYVSVPLRPDVGGVVLELKTRPMRSPGEAWVTYAHVR
jgi:SAM-dependent methyltransferase